MRYSYFSSQFQQHIVFLTPITHVVNLVFCPLHCIKFHLLVPNEYQFLVNKSLNFRLSVKLLLLLF